MDVDVFTLFPRWFDWYRTQRHVANVLALGSSFECIDPRATTPLGGGAVDDTPFGGGAGMVLRVDVMEAALRERYGRDPVELRERRRVIALTPGGRLLDDALAAELAAEPGMTLLCGRYEGFDQRIVDHFCTDEVSIGRYVLAGGELAAMVVCDTVLRKLPGAGGWSRAAGGRSLFATIQSRSAAPLPARGSFFAMSTVIDSLERAQLRRVPRFQAGDRVKVHFQVIEGTRRRTQVFEGVVIKRQGEGVRETFTVRKQSFGVGVERTFPVHSPKIERIEVAARGDVRRAKLYYLRGREGKRARVRERRYAGPEAIVEAGLLHDPAAQEAAAAAAAADSEVPGDAVDQQALAEAEGPDAAGGDESAAVEEAGAGEAAASDDQD